MIKMESTKHWLIVWWGEDSTIPDHWGNAFYKNTIWNCRQCGSWQDTSQLCEKRCHVKSRRKS